MELHKIHPKQVMPTFIETLNAFFFLNRKQLRVINTPEP